MKTIIKTASVKVMLYYNYNHFEASLQLENDNGLTMSDVDAARKDCQRLCDKAVVQYIKAKQHETKRTNSVLERRALEREVSEIKMRDAATWTVVEKAKIKALEDYNWESRWDYDDDEDDYNWNGRH